MALLGSGFDPGVTNVYCAYAQKHLLDEIHYVDIVDCNGGSHGKAFATNFNPEINIREITARGRYWENGEWKETDPLESVSKMFDYPGVGERKSFLLYHEELESLAKNLRGLKRIRFWMTFGESYLKHLEVLQNVGMTRIDEVEYQGQKIVPIKFLKALLPDPASLAENYTGKTSIGCLCEGLKDGQKKRLHLQHLRPRRDLQGGPRAGRLVHHGRPRRHRRRDDGHRQVEGPRRVQHGGDGSRSVPRGRRDAAACPGTWKER
jgi:saccharopine dehydrogenase (NAD+, L-lysine-forming)